MWIQTVGVKALINKRFFWSENRFSLGKLNGSHDKTYDNLEFSSFIVTKVCDESC